MFMLMDLQMNGQEGRRMDGRIVDSEDGRTDVGRDGRMVDSVSLMDWVEVDVAALASLKGRAERAAVVACRFCSCPGDGRGLSIS